MRNYFGVTQVVDARVARPFPSPAPQIKEGKGSATPDYLFIWKRSLAGSMEKLLDSMVIVARGASRNVRIVRIYPLTALFTFTMVIIIYCILGLMTEVATGLTEVATRMMEIATGMNEE